MVGQLIHGSRTRAALRGRLNWLRAAVLGANDGIVSVALGEYVSVSSQRDSERAQITQEKREIASTPEAELTELTALYEAKGLSAATARTVAAELTARNPLAAHLDAELHIDPADIPSPVQAAASALSFSSGSLLPMLAILLPPAGLRVPVAFAAVLAALALTGASAPGSAAATSAAPSCGWSWAGSSAWPSPTASGTCSAPPSTDGPAHRARRAGRARRGRARPFRDQRLRIAVRAFTAWRSPGLRQART